MTSKQGDLFSRRPTPPPEAPGFAGETFDPSLDLDRLTNNLQRVYALLLDGRWHTAEEIRSIGGSEGTRRVRDLRGATWGPLKVNRRRVEGSPGLWAYRLDLGTITRAIHARILGGGVR